jgi:hypothetical protein
MRRSIVAAVVLTLLLAGCVPADPRHPESLPVDGPSVTWDDYTTAFDVVRDCIEVGGLTVTDPVMDPVTNTSYSYSYQFNDLSSEDAMNVIARCETDDWTRIDMAIQTQTPPRMNSDLAARTSSCLADRGLSTTGDESSVGGFVRSVGESNFDAIVGCVGEGIQVLYPELTGYGVGY